MLVLILWQLYRDCEFGTAYVLSTLKAQLTVELVKCALLLNSLPVLQIYCCVVGVNIVGTVQIVSLVLVMC